MSSMATARLTYADLLTFPENGRRHELIGGRHRVQASPFIHHQRIVRRLTVVLDAHVRRNDLGEVLPSPVDVVLSEHDVVVPDLVFVRRERLSIVGVQAIHGAPDLVVEILSPSTRDTDLGRKRALYERHGVQEYWLLDPEVCTFSVLGRQEDHFATPLVYTSGDAIRSPLLPSLALPVSDLLRP